VQYTIRMWFGVVAVAAAWLCAACVVAVVVGQAIGLAERRRRDALTLEQLALEAGWITELDRLAP
jgi:hypothetical protein